jgi:hypothetical protein
VPIRYILYFREVKIGGIFDTWDYMIKFDKSPFWGNLIIFTPNFIDYTESDLANYIKYRRNEEAGRIGEKP